MNSSTTMSSHQAIMKCPWQWRQPFLDEKRESRKRKVGDGYFYDPVDPNFVDHLLPGYAKKFCGADVLESDEKENIQREIERLMTKKSNDPLNGNDDAKLDDAAVSSDEDDFDVSRENQALVDSILLMSKSVEASSLTLLASPKSVASSSPSSDEGSDDDELSSSSEEPFDLAEDRPAKLIAHRSSSLELVSDNFQETLFAVEDSELLDFQGTGATETD
ncbi:hypothetical protein F441_17669 [Phytophthora nicotianae CJ01A1]|uniref:Uncharacterized protein n=6 Tax=Phytophthora nicotianae TaxID=4792 RepID=W2PAE8_PHYN3|nr:hypothetical protein PPTG_19851 [Phytophthora nicotianae INRA-310]ETI35956.1 hypothetical protein F443_17792 [Phytophthora nicotianae P1569]ETK76193.1 hypothetical protein L915_17321 [Phytophthora nicotianae]ETO64678.1 hypothetical protein F444_17828 [Phytophthora nicotianae P1976]ETP05776.1 hypothetical protein F441_17669 [Phytophthora nicotianae CJ01A1]ETP33887.1 hypothetical protein F442_17649 [Phytophthora nicotianae P10297]